MDSFDLLRIVVGAIDALGLRYFVTGSTATIFYGEPRFTNDIDVVVDLDESQVAEFCRQFSPADFYVSESAALEAVRQKALFNVIQPASGLKVDVIIPETSDFNASRFARVRRLRVADDLEACFASPEDAIIKKLQFYQLGGSEKHLRDITGMLKTCQGQIDEPYIGQWSRQLKLDEVWQAVQQRMVEPE